MLTRVRARWEEPTVTLSQGKGSEGLTKKEGNKGPADTRQENLDPHTNMAGRREAPQHGGRLAPMTLHSTYMYSEVLCNTNIAR
jgi:hypothetical protein